MVSAAFAPLWPPKSAGETTFSGSRSSRTKPRLAGNFHQEYRRTTWNAPCMSSWRTAASCEAARPSSPCWRRFRHHGPGSLASGRFALLGGWPKGFTLRSLGTAPSGRGCCAFSPRHPHVRWLFLLWPYRGSRFASRRGLEATPCSPGAVGRGRGFALSRREPFQGAPGRTPGRCARRVG